jgi:hypothetical protein
LKKKVTSTFIESLQLKFEQLENGWLSNRYSPDLHQTGQIETDLHLRLNCPSSVWLDGGKTDSRATRRCTLGDFAPETVSGVHAADMMPKISLAALKNG